MLKLDAIAQAAFDQAAGTNLSQHKYNKDGQEDSLTNIRIATSNAADTPLSVEKGIYILDKQGAPVRFF